MTTGWKLCPMERDNLLRRFPPRYEIVVADHVTLLAGSAGGAAAAVPDPVGTARIIGRTDDGAGVEAMVVEIDGSQIRPDGGTWHITWSLGEGRKAHESNDVLRDGEFVRLEGPALTLVPARW